MLAKSSYVISSGSQKNLYHIDLFNKFSPHHQAIHINLNYYGAMLSTSAAGFYLCVGPAALVLTLVPWFATERQPLRIFISHAAVLKGGLLRQHYKLYYPIKHIKFHENKAYYAIVFDFI